MSCSFRNHTVQNTRLARFTLSLGVVLSACTRTALAQAELYFVTDLGPLGAESAVDINEHGQVVGATAITHHAYVYVDLNGDLVADEGELIDLGALAGDINDSKAYGVSNAGHVAGWSRATGSRNNAILWPPAAGLIDLGPDYVTTSGNYHAYGVNASGVVVGEADPFGTPWPAVWTNGVLARPWDPIGNGGVGNDINDAGQMVGWRNYQGMSGRFAYVWRNGTATDLGQLGGPSQFAEATSISNFGYIVGWANSTSGDTHAFLRRPFGANSPLGEMIDLGTFGGNYSSANGVNDRGQVVGVARNAFGQDRGFLYTNGELLKIDDLVDSTTWNVQIPYAINNRGQIVALGNRIGEGLSGLLLTPNDMDRDGLFDVWESADGGIDADGDGTIDLNLYALGARPDHKDLFVEVDAMVDRAPSAIAMAMVRASFDAAPVDNPDGQQGIKLHILVDETDLPRVPWNAMIDVDQDGANDWPAAFDPTKALHFGTVLERADSNAANILNAKRLAFRYCIFAHTYNASNSSGLAELPGNDFIVSLGAWTIPGGTPEEQAGTFMHEFGHTLGLRHGGGDDINYKPNYLSVMSYIYQVPLGWWGNWWPNYSSEVLPTLDEYDLDETAGIGGSAGVPVEIGPPPSRLVRMAGAVDWDRDGAADDVGVTADINEVDAGGLSIGDYLVGHDDWPAIIYGLGGNGDFAEGVHMSVVGLVEMTLDDQEANALATFDCDPCDTTCDGNVDGADVEAFVTAMTTPAQVLCTPCAGDVSGDGQADEGDILLFVECLLGL